MSNKKSVLPEDIRLMEAALRIYIQCPPLKP